MTRNEFLRRCGTAYDMGLCTPERLRLLEKWVDFVLRFEGGQTRYVAEFLEDECRRCQPPGNGAIGQLAGDVDGYALCQLTALLTHPCQRCGEDPSAWHTRAAFCPHREDTE